MFSCEGNSCNANTCKIMIILKTIINIRVITIISTKPTISQLDKARKTLKTLRNWVELFSNLGRIEKFSINLRKKPFVVYKNDIKALEMKAESIWKISAEILFWNLCENEWKIVWYY